MTPQKSLRKKLVEVILERDRLKETLVENERTATNTIASLRAQVAGQDVSQRTLLTGVQITEFDTIVSRRARDAALKLLQDDYHRENATRQVRMARRAQKDPVFECFWKMLLNVTKANGKHKLDLTPLRRFLSPNIPGTIPDLNQQILDIAYELGMVFDDRTETYFNPMQSQQPMSVSFPDKLMHKLDPQYHPPE